MEDDYEINDILIYQHAQTIIDDMSTGQQVQLFPETDTASVSVLSDLSVLGVDLQAKIRNMKK